MKITAYIPCHNGARFLPEVLPALLGQTRKADQYLLIDDRSTDDSAKIAQQFGFTVLRTGPDHFGLAAGRNVALAHAQGDVLAGIDADVVAEPDYLAEVENVYAQRPEIVGMCGRLTEKYTDTVADLWRSCHMGQNWGDKEIIDPRILFGCSASHRVEMLRKLGGWNPRYMASFEDMDLSMRIRAAGGRTLYSPRGRLWHLKRDTLESVLRQFWIWESPNADFHGRYESLEKWGQVRLPEIWHDYRRRRLQDRPTPKIAIVTCLLPWAWIIRDLHLLFNRHGRAADLHTLATSAQRILATLGSNPKVAEWMGKWLRDLISELTPIAGPPNLWDPAFLRAIELAALASIPDNSYWNAVNSVFVDAV